MKLSKEKIVREEYAKFEKGRIFSISDFSVYINDKKLRWILRNSFEKGEVITAFPTIYYKVKMNSFFPDKILSPSIVIALKALTKRAGQKFQDEGGRAANLLGLSTQVPLIDVFYTDKNSKEFQFFSYTVRFIKTRCHDVFQYPYERVGWAISTLYYLGPLILDQALIVKKLRKGLTKEEYQCLLNAKKPSWMQKILEN
ncbi:hypothetical protein B9T31_05095 [Acinetobacter sp. ANC 4558]|uniref:DUF6088 family protein n=1 Tax=Acinetobacter sp. ANC 4558 TaxID=1977876 RepID=UPI000A34C1C2|nr:DUF6088 family protein [Acinetobacter sp. ANC 4558]OTG86991.1 hypothetical protein B9T31_05095 [Acinetobacter sp. ANC 4558]